MRGLGLRLGELNELPEWEQRLYVRCAVAEEQRDADILRQSLEFIGRLIAGGGDEPTEDRPVKESTVRSGDQIVTTKKVVDFDFEKRRTLLQEQGDTLKKETQGIVDKMRAEVMAKRGKEATGG